MMRTGVQFTGNLAANEQRRWTTHGWPAAWHVIWYMVPATVRSGAPQVEWTVAVERNTVDRCTYWITVKNLTGTGVSFDGRYAVLN